MQILISKFIENFSYWLSEYDLEVTIQSVNINVSTDLH